MVEEYVKLVEEFGLDQQSVYHRVGVKIVIRNDKIVSSNIEYILKNEKRELEPIAG